jgi:hypothetical protein
MMVAHKQRESYTDGRTDKNDVAFAGRKVKEIVSCE